MSDVEVDITFQQYALPALMSGDLGVKVTQTVTNTAQSVTYDKFTAEQPFAVTGERFSLAPGDVKSVFPPVGSQGEYDNCLAHVVLTSPTLPWQRAPGAQQSEDPPASRATWLAVLLFDESDPPPVPQNVTLKQLEATETTFCPSLEPEPGEAWTDPVTIIDVPIEHFNRTAPTANDISWTAHVRRVDITAKAASAKSLPERDYSVVFGNRLPITGNTSTAHLVSLENWSDYLPDDDGNASAILPTGTNAARLVTLHSWTFISVDPQQTFTQLLEHVDVGHVALPFTKPDRPMTDADRAVQSAFGMGYTAMDHDVRDGSRTVSWYRGPLLPLGPPAIVDPGWDDADELLNYDPTTGMFDVSYATAWQLGRLLALHDSAFSAALYRWKLTRTQTQVNQLEQQIIDEQLPPVVRLSAQEGQALKAAAHARMGAVLRDVVGPALRTLGGTRGEKE